MEILLRFTLLTNAYAHIPQDVNTLPLELTTSGSYGLKVMRQSENGPFYYNGDSANWTLAIEAISAGRPVVCSVCHDPVVAALTGKDARRLNIRPGINCRNGHFSKPAVLNPFPEQHVWDSDDPELDPKWVPGEVSDLSP